MPSFAGRLCALLAEMVEGMERAATPLAQDTVGDTALILSEIEQSKTSLLTEHNRAAGGILSFVYFLSQVEGFFCCLRPC